MASSVASFRKFINSRVRTTCCLESVLDVIGGPTALDASMKSYVVGATMCNKKEHTFSNHVNPVNNNVPIYSYMAASHFFRCLHCFEKVAPARNGPGAHELLAWLHLISFVIYIFEKVCRARNEPLRIAPRAFKLSTSPLETAQGLLTCMHPISSVVYIPRQVTRHRCQNR